MPRWSRRRRAAAAALGVAVMAGGCRSKEAAPVLIPNRTLGPVMVAVAPALNFSGAADFDPAGVADLMASELGYLRDAQVIPVSRVLAVLARQGRRQVESPEHALEVAEQVGADVILVFAVTEYDPYDPPVMGIAAQLYAVRASASFRGGDAVPGVLEDAADSDGAGGEPAGPVAQTQRVFDASHIAVVEAVKRYAEERRAEEGPWGWKRHLVSQRHYLRFCCYMTLNDLVREHELSTVRTLSLR